MTKKQRKKEEKVEYSRWIMQITAPNTCFGPRYSSKRRMFELAGEGLWELLKALGGKIKYGFLSTDQKVECNLKKLQEKYWFEQLSKEAPFFSRPDERRGRVKNLFNFQKETPKAAAYF